MMLESRVNRLREAYVTTEGFLLNLIENTVLLTKGDKVCHTWQSGAFSHIEMVLAIYAALVEPPLLYN